MKRLITRFVRRPMVARRVVRLALKAHNYSYRVAGRLSQVLESDGGHPKHRLMDYHTWFADHLDARWDVLEIGCGGGFLAQDLRGQCATLTVIELERDKFEEARDNLPGLEVIHGDATTHPFGRTFDAVILSNVLEHIEDRVPFLTKVKGLAPTILIRVPLIDRDWITLYKLEQGVEHRLDPTHFTEYTEDQFLAELTAAGLQPREIRTRYGELYAVVALS